MALAREHGLDTELLSPDGVSKLLPGAKNRWLGGMHTASDMKAEPWLAVPALARLAERSGAVIVENCAVRRLDMAAGKVAGVATEKGRIAAPSVVVAGGAWSSLFLAAHGVRIPQLSVRASVAATAPLPVVYEGGAVDTNGAFRRRADGGYTLAAADFHEFLIGPDAFRHLRKFIPQILANPTANRFFPASPKGYPDAWTTPRHWREDVVSPFERMRVLNPRPAMKALGKVSRQFAADFPELGEVRLASAWAGMIDIMPDVVPVVDHVAALPGLIVATGMSGHGFGIGPGFGRVIASMVRGEAAGYDLGRFRISRFAKGEKLISGPSL
jgi:glycine/D-amino acid oxidase-like deaminating enzyme